MLAACSPYDAGLLNFTGGQGGMDGGVAAGTDASRESGPAPDDGGRPDRRAGTDAEKGLDSAAEDDSGAEPDSGALDAGGCVPNPDDDGSCPEICPEVCDGIDNNCNGQVDEGELWESKGDPCTAGTGECLASGNLICRSDDPSGPVVCDAVPRNEQAEICDGLDNNCDGTTDDGYPDADDDGIANCVDTDYDAGTIQPFERKRIAIDADQVDETLTDFPLLVHITGDSTLSVAREDGADIYFTEDDGATVLNSEVEYWQQTDGTLVAWVGIPSVSSSTDTVFYLYYGDQTDHSSESSPEGVWDADFEGVWHLSSDADSSRYGRHGTNGGSTDTDGIAAGARFFDGSSHISMGQGLLPDEQYYTVTAWVQPDLSNGEGYFAVLANSSTGSPYGGSTLYLRRTDGAVGGWDWLTDITDGWQFSPDHRVYDDIWAFIAVTTDKAVEGSMSSSINGRPWRQFHTGDTTDGLANTTDGRLYIGRFDGVYSYYYHFWGVIDEVRISSTARSSAWIKAEYESQRNGSTFLSIEDD